MSKTGDAFAADSNTSSDTDTALPFPINVPAAIGYLGMDTLIINLGSDTTKCCHASNTNAGITYPTVIAEPMNRNIITLGMGSKPFFVGEEALSKRTLRLSYRYPIQRGEIAEWKWVEPLLHHTFYNELRAAPEENCLIFVESSPLPSRCDRERLITLMFEQFYIPSVYFTSQSVMALASTGRRTGLVVDCGHDVTWIVPIYEGHILPYAVRQLAIGGNTISLYLLELLMRRGIPFATSAERRNIRDIKERSAYVSVTRDDQQLDLQYEAQQIKDYPPAASAPLRSDSHDLPVIAPFAPSSSSADDENSATKNIAHRLSSTTASSSSTSRKQRPVLVEYELPDGQRIQFGRERFQCTEPLFNPSLLTSDAKIAAACNIQLPTAAPTLTSTGGDDEAKRSNSSGSSEATTVSVSKGIHQLVYDAIMACDASIHMDLWASVVITGGTSLLPGIDERLSHELHQLIRALPSSSSSSAPTAVVPSSIGVTTVGHATSAACNGARLLCDQLGMRSQWITKEEYDEYGPTVVHRKCI